jgi:hypothetical protein
MAPKWQCQALNLVDVESKWNPLKMFRLFLVKNLMHRLHNCHKRVRVVKPKLHKRDWQTSNRDLTSWMTWPMPVQKAR